VPRWLARLARDSAPATAGIVVMLAVWQIATVAGDIPMWLLPSPKAILVATWDSGLSLVRHTGITLYETAVGFVLAVVVGIPLAALLVSSELIWRTLYPIVAAVQSIPKTAIAPLLLVWLGTGEMPKVIIAFLIAFFPIVVNTATGMTLVERDLLHLVRSLSATKAQTFWHIRLPNALPYIFSAAKVAVTLAVVGAVIGEFVGADAGLGYVILVASSQLKTDVAFVAILLLAVLGMLLFWAVSLLERLVLPWCTQQHETIVQV
jgi:NitT/TauT family transport system permease protein